jgi:hypothetical protein
MAAPLIQQHARPRVVLTRGHLLEQEVVGDLIKGNSSNRLKMYSDVVPPGRAALAVVVTIDRPLAIFLPSQLDGEEEPHDHPGGLDGS